MKLEEELLALEMDDREKRECLAFAGWRVSADRSDSTQNSNRR